MKSYLDTLECLGYAMPKELGVILILNSLNNDYNQFVQNYNMHSMGKTLAELHAMLKLFEKGIPKKAKTSAVLAIREGKIQKDKKKPQGENGKGKGKNKLAYAPKAKIPPPPKRDNPAKDSICHHCKEVGHWRRNCSSYHAKLKKRNNANVASTSGYPKETMGYYFYYPLENKIFVSQNAEFFENSFMVQEASGSHRLLKMSGSDKGLELIQEEDTQPSENTSEAHNEVAPIEVEPQNVGVPIRRSARIPQVPDRYGYYVDIEEYELGDLNEPPNYKVALADPESDKWLEAMNTKMQSMKDNQLRGVMLHSSLDVYDILLMGNNISMLAEVILALMEKSKKGYTLMMEKPNYRKSQGAKTPTEDDTKSQTRYVFVLNGGAVDWKSAKKSTIAMSSTEAENIAVAKASMEAIWMRKFIDGLGDVMPSIKRPIEMLCDNENALAIASDPKILKGARHFSEEISLHL
ncbi:zinc finger, CCHC-type containing protein [Tanacetum coccineum]